MTTLSHPLIKASRTYDTKLMMPLLSLRSRSCLRVELRPKKLKILRTVVKALKTK